MSNTNKIAIWVKASERLPEQTIGSARQIVTKWQFADGVQLRICTANELADITKVLIDKNNLEWLELNEQLFTSVSNKNAHTESSEAIDFVEWLLSNDCEYAPMGRGLWGKKDDTNGTKTTAELYGEWRGEIDQPTAQPSGEAGAVSDAFAKFLLQNFRAIWVDEIEETGWISIQPPFKEYSTEGAYLLFKQSQVIK